ncbi:MAG: DsbC family protein [Nitrosomonadales bacterium]|nr:DsbC family protein [Nitrosomonadales bacterium]
MKPFSCLVLLALVFADAASADEAGIKAAMEKRFPYQQLISVTKTPFSGLYEVVFEDQMVYTDEQMNYLFSGNIIEMRTMENLTAAREKKLFAVNLGALPLDLAIRNVKGNGKRKLAVFSDANCSYCRSLEKELAGLTDVTIYLFPVSLLDGSEVKARAVWCSPDRLKAWEDMMLRGAAPPSHENCDTAALAEFSLLAKKRKISVTPTLIFGGGTMKAGWMSRDQIEKQLGSPAQ